MTIELLLVATPWLELEWRERGNEYRVVGSHGAGWLVVLTDDGTTVLMGCADVPPPVLLADGES